LEILAEPTPIEVSKIESAKKQLYSDLLRKASPKVQIILKKLERSKYAKLFPLNEPDILEQLKHVAEAIMQIKQGQRKPH